MDLTNDCEGCVHSEGYNSDYMGNCEDCSRNPKYSDFYWKEESETK